MVIKNIDYINSLTMTEVYDMFNKMTAILDHNKSIRDKYN